MKVFLFSLPSSLSSLARNRLSEYAGRIESVDRFPFTVYCLPFTVYRLPFTVYRLPFTVYRLPFTVYRLPLILTRIK
jgi:hypothetical protein